MYAIRSYYVIFVNSDPAGAEIYLTNLSVTPDNLTVSDTEGLTPREFFVEPGTYRLFLKKYGYITWWNESVTVLPGGNYPYMVNLTKNNPVYGAIHLDTNPSDSDLTLHREIPNITSLRITSYNVCYTKLLRRDKTAQRVERRSSR